MTSICGADTPREESSVAPCDMTINPENKPVAMHNQSTRVKGLSFVSRSISASVTLVLSRFFASGMVSLATLKRAKIGIVAAAI